MITFSIRLAVSLGWTLLAWAVLSVAAYLAHAYWFDSFALDTLQFLLRGDDGAEQAARFMVFDRTFLRVGLGVAAVLAIWDRILMLAALALLESEDDAPRG